MFERGGRGGVAAIVCFLCRDRTKMTGVREEDKYVCGQGNIRNITKRLRSFIEMSFGSGGRLNNNCFRF